MVQQKTDLRAAQKPRDFTVIKVMVALVLLIASVFALRAIGRVYATVSGFDAIYPAAKTVAIVALVLAAASIVGLIAARRSVVGTVSGYVLPVALLAAFSALVLRRYLNDQMRLLYFVHAAVYCLYIIELLYHAEFFTVSLVTLLAGWTFYRCVPGVSVFWTVLLAIVIVLAALTAYLAHRGHGVIKLFGKKIRLFPKTFAPLPILVTCALWLLCLIASVVVGSLLAYYCMFAAIAFELISAVYYTFQLK